MLLRRLSCIFAILVSFSPFLVSRVCSAEAALLMEEPFGLFGAVNPTGHNAIYFENICAETPIHVRRCRPGELGSVIARYDGVNGYDWIAIPLIPYLYSVETPDEVPSLVNHARVDELRENYRNAHFSTYGIDKAGGSYVRNGWKQLIGVSYERRVYAFRFKTTLEQDEALIARLNDGPNDTHFHLLTRNCADFSREVLNNYFPRTFRRSFFPDVGITTPKQVTYKLVRYARKHPELQLTVFEIPQIPGYRWRSHSNKDIAESFTTTAYAIPLTLVNPYLAGIIFVDYIFRGRYHLMPKNLDVLTPQNLSALTAPPATEENSAGANLQVFGAASADRATSPSAMGADTGLKESSSSQ